MTNTAPFATPPARRGVRLAFLALLAGALSIAFAPIFVRLSEVGPTATAFWRPALAVPALWLWLGVERRGTSAPRRPSGWADVAALGLAGALFAGDLFFWHWSVRFTSVANSTLFANFAPIFVTLASWALFRERFTATFLAALALAIAGAVVLMGDSLTIDTDHLFGDALGIVTAMFYGAYIITVGRLRARFSTATIMTWSAIVTTVCLLPATWVIGEALIPATLYGWAVLLGLALFSHAGGQSLIAYALAHLPAAFSSLSLLLQPVAAAVLAWLILGEPLGPLQALGGAIVLAAIALAHGGMPRVGA
ncbi:MAG: DMT family transporter [Alphaproteobacteria bacterium]